MAWIHPPVQGGNKLILANGIQTGDTPSRTGRKLHTEAVLQQFVRYTLPYREETLSVYAGFNPPKHPVVQIAQIVFFHY